MPEPRHTLADSIAAKLSCDAALAAAQTAADAANAAIRIDLAISGPVSMPDASFPGVFDVWWVEPFSGVGPTLAHTIFHAVDARKANVPGPPPVSPDPPPPDPDPTIAEAISAVAAIEDRLHALLARVNTINSEESARVQ